MHLIRNRHEFTYHHEQGRFLIPDFHREEAIKNVGYMLAEDHVIELKDSQDADYLFQLNDALALGEEIVWQRYDSAFLTPKWVQPTQQGPYALWNLSNGERVLTLKGYHLGQLRGARLLDDARLVTWGRDFLLRAWDLTTGMQTQVVPLPALLDSDKRPILSTRSYTKWTNAAFDAYLANDSEQPSLSITLMIQTEQASRTESYCQPINNNIPYTPHLFDRTQNRARVRGGFLELEDVEAGYSDSLVLTDGRLLTGGITYGFPQHTYVWDGGLQLIILYTSLHGDAGFEFDGEVVPGVIRLKNYHGTVTFNIHPASNKTK